MVLYLYRREDAEKLSWRGRLEVDREMTFVRPYERRASPVRCFKCHRFAHVKARFPSVDRVCSRCAEHGHTAKATSAGLSHNGPETSSHLIPGSVPSNLRSNRKIDSINTLA